MIALLLCGLIAGACAAPQFEFSYGPPRSSQQGTEYKITMSLPNFDEKDIIVTTYNGSLTVQATNKIAEGFNNRYQYVEILPDTVNVTGYWIFEAGVLKITFPLKDGAVVKSKEPITTTELSQFDTTVQPMFGGSREEIETNVNEGVQDVDIGLGRGDLNKESELRTNEITGRNAL